MESNLTIQQCYLEFTEEFGQKQFRVIKEKLFTSKSYLRNSHIIIANKNEINAGMLIAIVSDIRFFAFGSKTKIAIASLLLLEQWIQSSNSDYRLVSKEQVDKLIEKIMINTSKMLW